MKRVYLVVFSLVFMWSFSQISSHSTFYKRDHYNEIMSPHKNKNLTQYDIQRYNAKGWVHYSDFGAKGDGKTDDIAAIAATHAFANKHNLKVKGDDKATYYIGAKKKTVVVLTSTDFGSSSFIIDDTNVEDRNANIFSVKSMKQSFKPDNIVSLRRNQRKLDISLSATCLVIATNSNVNRYIRYGPNQNNGSAQTDVFLVDKNGKIDQNTPIIWNFDQITDIIVLPVDETKLTITGGKFTTIANKENSEYSYYARGISIERSNVVVDGLEHHIISEGKHGAPYRGFISISHCANVTIRNSILTGHKVYHTIGSAGATVPMGTYDININRALNITFENCSQTNDINDTTYWGIMGSNYCKNLVFDSSILSRFDAHMGVANATIKNSTLGYQGVNAIGSGTFLIENSTIRGNNLINLRSDYGSTWEGEFIIRNCVFVPRSVKSGNVNLIGGSNSGQHDFGYTCYMPEKITIENLEIKDSGHPENYKGPAIFSNFNKDRNNETNVEKYPFIITKEVILKNVTAESGKPLRVSDNSYMFKNVTLGINNSNSCDFK